MIKLLSRKAKKEPVSILVLGTDGMLGHYVYEHLTTAQMYDEHIGRVSGLTGPEIIKAGMFDDESRLRCAFDTYKHFDYVINCVAYTDTAKAEHDYAARKLSLHLNAEVPKLLATVCKERKTKLIHVSTDWVFSEYTNPRVGDDSIDGSSVYAFLPDDKPAPKNAYGLHKLLGEDAIKSVYGQSTDEYVILRTSWLYGAHNSKSFIHKFLANAYKKYMANESITVTENETSVPTSVATVYHFMERFIYGALTGGVHHAVPRLSGDPHTRLDGVSRFAWAVEILRLMDDFQEHRPCSTDEEMLPFDKMLAKLEPSKNNPDTSFYPVFTTMHDITGFANHPTWDAELARFCGAEYKNLVSHMIAANQTQK